MMRDVKSISSFSLGGLALLASVWGCATDVTSAQSTSYQQSVAGSPQPVTSSPPPSIRPPVHSPPRVPHPAGQSPVFRPPAPAAPGVSVRSSPAAIRLMSIPAAIAAVLLWPSSLGDSSMDRGWQETLNPITLMPWTSREEYTLFWQLPQHQREQLIQASRNAMANSVGAPEAAPQTAERRRPGQTCENSVLSYLQAEKDRICTSIPGESCSPKKVSPKRLDKVPCSAAKHRIQAIQNCLTIRQFIQDECFDGMPDEPHTRAMNELKSGIAHCLALEARNCAPGHPMSER
jgi:hypothetical protein